MNALSTISQLPDNREQQKTFVNAVIEEIVNGDNDPARVFVKLRIIGDAIKDILDSKLIQAVTIKEVAKYPGGFEINGCKATISSRKTYDFESCGYSEWERLDAEIKGLADRKKAIETMLKSLVNPMVDAETGAIVYQPNYKETEFITVK